MEFGLVLTVYSGDWNQTSSDARLAEEAGIDSIWIYDHLISPRTDRKGDAFEGWTALAALAGVTERVRIGPLVLAPAFRNPGLLAKMATTLDHASGGRLDLGLGAGWYEGEYRAFGYDFPSGGRRRRYLEEYIDVLRLLFAGGPVDYAGAFIEMENAYCRPVPLRQPAPPIVVGASGPRMLELVGRKADVWNCPAGLIPRLEKAREHVLDAAAGRLVRTTLQIPVAVGRSGDEAETALEAWRNQPPGVGDIDVVGITGTIDEAVEQVSVLADRGADGVVAVLPGTRRRPDFIEAYGELAARYRG